MGQVIWSRSAHADLARLLAFLHTRNPEAALRAAREIDAAARVLATLPEAGRPMGDGSGQRELLIPFAGSAYILRYRIDAADDAVVIRAWHGRESRR